MLKLSKWLLIIVVFLSACNRTQVIPEQDMVSILVKVCLTDATVIHYDLRAKFYDKDTINYYDKVFKEYGYTNQQFDSSLKYYSKNPKQLDAIYDKVVFELSKMQTGLVQKSKDDLALNDSLNDLWTLNKSYNFTFESPQDFIVFDFPTRGLGLYTLSYEIQIFPDDQSVEPQLKYYFYIDNKTDKGDVVQYVTVPYTKTGNKQSIKKELELKDKSVTHIKGVILDFNNPNRDFKNHASVSDIKLIYLPDSLRIEYNKQQQNAKRHKAKK